MNFGFNMVTFKTLNGLGCGYLKDYPLPYPTPPAVSFMSKILQQVFCQLKFYKGVKVAGPF